METTPTDDLMRLFIGVRAGNRTAEEAFFCWAWNRLRAFASCFQIPRADFEDFASEVLEKVFERLDQYDPKRGKLSTWLFVIARNHAISRLRSANARPATVAIDEDREPLIDLEPGPGSGEPIPAITANPLLDQLKEQLEKLSDADRLLLTLAYSGVCAREIAEELKTTPDAVRQRKRRILQSLKAELLEQTGT